MTLEYRIVRFCPASRLSRRTVGYGVREAEVIVEATFRDQAHQAIAKIGISSRLKVGTIGDGFCDTDNRVIEEIVRSATNNLLLPGTVWLGARGLRHKRLSHQHLFSASVAQPVRGVSRMPVGRRKSECARCSDVAWPFASLSRWARLRCDHRNWPCAVTVAPRAMWYTRPDLPVEAKIMKFKHGVAALSGVLLFGVITASVDAGYCPEDCAWPHDHKVDVVDFLTLLGDWGVSRPYGPSYGHCDIYPAPWGDGVTDISDFLTLMQAWGDCPYPYAAGRLFGDQPQWLTASAVLMVPVLLLGQASAPLNRPSGRAGGRRVRPAARRPG